MQKQLRNYILRHSHRFVSPWVILTIDLVLVMLAFMSAYLLRFNFLLDATKVEMMFRQIFIYGLFHLFFFLLLNTHRGIIRHTGLQDILRMFLAVVLSSGTMLLCCSFLMLVVNFQSINFSISIVLIATMASILILLLFRFSIKVVYLSLTRHRTRQDLVLIFGAGEMGIATQNTINATTNTPFRVVGFIDDSPGKQGKTIGGVPVYSFNKLDKEFVHNKGVSQIILAVQNMPAIRRKEIIEHCLALDVKLLTVPGYKDWQDGRLNVRQIRKVKIQELLQRPPIMINNSKLNDHFINKVVMVTGAAGSIGSELARQIKRRQPKKLILLDQAETPLFELEQEFIKEGDNNIEIHYVLCDVSQEKNLRQVFKCHRPDIIYHAAAYKHVPMLENNPFEALRVNAFGTRNLALLAFEFKASDFVLVSTDKVVNPTSFMGVSKRLAEIYIQSLGNYTHSSTRFITTRFGNVLGSNGSVIPIFEKQIASGGPVTVTHPEMTRFFMTIPEACELVLEASVMGHGGEILVFDMGEQVRIIDVARKMIKLSGLEPDVDINIVISGLRPGEKMYEELFSHSEENLPTHHPKIMIARLESQDFEKTTRIFEQIEMMMSKRSFKHIISVIKQLVPEYQVESEEQKLIGAEK